MTYARYWIADVLEWVERKNNPIGLIVVGIPVSVFTVPHVIVLAILSYRRRWEGK